ncbi:MAG: hypothetical protein DYG94_12160 [Leptolyngbya sp. PLA3]|nr:MAG: hypothetical protein EDM82_13700 [Cyanobacteria bacterium CYA]MCE7969479.1 hypothetical protein [Leptolyngbya sp. PL-A3]
MRPFVRLAETVHIVALALWLSALITGALVAVTIFTTMRELAPTFGFFHAYTGAHADLGAGFIQARVFALADITQFAACSLAMLSFIAAVAIGRAVARASTMVRATLLACALTMFSYQYFILAPRMDTNARAYWKAARAGDSEQARLLHAKFMEDHPASTRTHGFILLFVSGTLVASTWTLSGGRPCPEEAR